MVASPCWNTRRYLPPTRTSSSQDSSVSPKDAGTHQRRNSSARVHASNTRRAGASTVRRTTSSRSETRSARVGFGVWLAVLVGMVAFLSFQFTDDGIEPVEARGPVLLVPLEPRRLFF